MVLKKGTPHQQLQDLEFHFSEKCGVWGLNQTLQGWDPTISVLASLASEAQH